MVLDLKVSVRRQIYQLRKDLAAATGRVAALRDDVKRHELIYDMLDRDDRLECGLCDSARRGYPGCPECPRDGKRKTPSLPPAVGRMLWSKDGRIKRTGRGMYQKS